MRTDSNGRSVINAASPFFFSDTIEDRGVSPVVGSILMVAVAVIASATVIAFANQMGGDGLDEPGFVSFRIAPVDTDNNGRTDAVRITYVSGPRNIAADDIRLHVTDINGTVVPATYPKTTPWNPGEWVLFDAPGPALLHASVGMLGETVLARTVRVDE